VGVAVGLVGGTLADIVESNPVRVSDMGPEPFNPDELSVLPIGKG